MKKPVYLLLIVLLFFKADGLQLLLKCQQFVIRCEMREWMGSGAAPTETLRISESVFRKHRIGDDELQLDGKLYDIRSVSRSGNEVVLVVVNDTHEANILRFITGLGKHRDPASGNSARLKHIPPFVAVSPQFSAARFVIRASPLCFVKCLWPLSTGTSLISTPPPDVA